MSAHPVTGIGESGHWTGTVSVSSLLPDKEPRRRIPALLGAAQPCWAARLAGQCGHSIRLPRALTPHTKRTPVGTRTHTDVASVAACPCHHSQRGSRAVFSELEDGKR